MGDKPNSKQIPKLKLHPILRRIINFNKSYSGTFFDYYTDEELETYINDIKDADEALNKWSKNDNLL